MVVHHCSGSASGTPASTSRAIWRAAWRRSASVLCSSSASVRRNSPRKSSRDSTRTTVASAPSSPATASSADSVTSCGDMPVSSQSSSMNRDGSMTSSPSVWSTAVTRTRSVARVNATWNRRRSSSRRSRKCDTGVAGSTSWSTRSTRSCWPKIEPVSPRLGHSRSCTPATTTRLNCLPTAPCAVNSATASGVAARRSRTPVGSSCSNMLFTNSSSPPCVLRSVKSPAASNNAMTASRSRSACEPVVPPRSATAVR